MHAAIYIVNPISESRKPFSHHRMNMWIIRMDTQRWSVTRCLLYAMPCHAIPFMKYDYFVQSVRAHLAKLRHRVATRIPTESPIVWISIKLKITTAIVCRVVTRWILLCAQEWKNCYRFGVRVVKNVRVSMEWRFGKPETFCKATAPCGNARQGYDRRSDEVLWTPVAGENSRSY